LTDVISIAYYSTTLKRGTTRISEITLDDLEKKRGKLQNLRLVILVGCSNEDLLHKFHEIAPNAKVIGFKKDIAMESWIWNIGFWKYAVGDGMEVGRAARKAAILRIDKALVVYDKENVVYLNSLDDFGMDEISLLYFKALWEQWKKYLERRINNWLEQQKKKAIEEFLRQLCAAPAGLIIISSYQFWRWRKRSKEPS